MFQGDLEVKLPTDEAAEERGREEKESEEKLEEKESVERRSRRAKR
jgi:hypothetical protein